MPREPREVLGVSAYATWPQVRSAFRALARRYHPDGTAPDPARMAELNAAYELLERALLSGAAARPADRSPETPQPVESPGVPVGPGPMVAGGAGRPGRAPTGSLLWRIQAARHGDSPTLDFGEYAGWTIAEVAEHDPRYLTWLSRHSSGIRFRRAIEAALGSSRDLGRRAALLS